ncbi:septum formation initiator family protein [Paenibacillus larvae]|uniref:Septum formation initiator n=2 Tax=Paenibacillus larvae TaxID=1464 RepID=V9WCP8_9BACL|nr:septum formation initiator family protein [Paenibacillus larvae]AHD07629.1 septum formation initiator [Paenibacillus larvae subsp. larvae DSM 25430]AQR78884.1 hypothetical protein BXP28_18060 [Paenibacillus larvae subsp. larvae]AVF24058.1 septum formation initiator [Paenibacillus larvae subsp. larvae]AVG14189.1 septum formation initiator [Paenibacillus larvae subsp. larvae DSM 25430]ETK28895.1 septum formation initiator [Paenibacillus larvae subsp. larvae DSM 25719]
MTKTTKRNNPGTRRRMRLIMIVFAAFLLWAGVTLWGQYGMMKEKEAANKQLDQQLEQVKKQNENLQKEITRLGDDEYIEQKIRQELNYTKEGETLFSTNK